jgi:hypothetical protein
MIATWQKSMQTLRDFARKEQSARCELCAREIGENHQHLFDPAKRLVICGCDGCCLLFDTDGRTKYRRVPRDPRLLGNFHLGDAQWEQLLIPISLGFLYRSSSANQTIASYPSPFGVVESSIDENAWRAIVAGNAALAELRDDVEALLVNRLRGQREYFIAPIDRCFQLVGIVRRHWKGMNGGDQVWIEVNQYLAALRKGARE